MLMYRELPSCHESHERERLEPKACTNCCGDTARISRIRATGMDLGRVLTLFQPSLYALHLKGLRKMNGSVQPTAGPSGTQPSTKVSLTPELLVSLSFLGAALLPLSIAGLAHLSCLLIIALIWLLIRTCSHTSNLPRSSPTPSSSLLRQVNLMPRLLSLLRSSVSRSTI